MAPTEVETGEGFVPHNEIRLDPLNHLGLDQCVDHFDQETSLLKPALASTPNFASISVVVGFPSAPTRSARCVRSHWCG